MASNSRRHTAHVSKKNDGQEVDLRFSFLGRKDLTATEKIQVELWVKETGTAILASFKMRFPDIS